MRHLTKIKILSFSARTAENDIFGRMTCGGGRPLVGATNQQHVWCFYPRLPHTSHSPLSPTIPITSPIPLPFFFPLYLHPRFQNGEITTPPYPPLHGTSPQLCPPWLRAPSAFCARVGSCGALMHLHAQWRGLVWRAWPAAAFKVCPLRASAPCTAPRRSAALPGCARRALAVHVMARVGL